MKRLQTKRESRAASPKWTFDGDRFARDVQARHEGLTANKVALMYNLPPTSIFRLFHDRKLYGVNVIWTLAEALGLSVADYMRSVD